MKKASKILLTMFSVGVLLTLLAGGLALLGYVVAMCIGGNVATEICEFIYTTYFKWVIRICSVSVAFGLIGMYLGKAKALSLKTNSEVIEETSEGINQ